MGQDPQELTYETDELRHDIERTREGMDATLGQIEDRVSPRRIVERRKARVRSAFGDARDRVMGTAHDMRSQGQDKAEGAGARLREVGDELSGRVDDIQEKGRRQYEGNPLAAGLIAFGAGALLGSLLPKTEPEQKVADDLKERLQPAAEELRHAGQEVAQDVKQEAQERVEEVKQTAADASGTVKDDARDSAQHMRAETEDRAQHVRNEASR